MSERALKGELAADVELKNFGTLLVGATGDVEAIVATLGAKDRENDFTPLDAFPTGVKVRMSSYSHDTIMGAMLGTGVPDAPPVGKGAVFIEGDKAIFRGKFFMDTQRGREAYLTTKAMGPDQEWSHAYRKLQVDAPNSELKTAGVRRVLTKILPFEVSPVGMGGGIGTRTVMIKAAADGDAAAKAAAETEAKATAAAAQATAIARIDDVGALYARLSSSDQRVAAGHADRPPLAEAGMEEMPAESVSGLACAALLFGVKRLGIECPRLRWFKSAGPDQDSMIQVGEFDESTQPATIWLSSELKGDQLLRILGEELFHGYQFHHGRKFSEPAARDAGRRFVDDWHAYRQRFMANVLASHPSNVEMRAWRATLAEAEDTLKRTAALAKRRAR